jgi:hypothetical protein
MNTNNQLSVIGKSVLENQFINIKWRRENKKYCFGPRCMESTTTKGLFDFLNLLNGFEQSNS